MCVYIFFFLSYHVSMKWSFLTRDRISFGWFVCLSDPFWSQAFFFFYFYLYIYPPDSQESDGGAIHRVSNYPDLLPEMPRYCCPLVI